jgi:hypothetical protein
LNCPPLAATEEAKVTAVPDVVEEQVADTVVERPVSLASSPSKLSMRSMSISTAATGVGVVGAFRAILRWCHASPDCNCRKILFNKVFKNKVMLLLTYGNISFSVILAAPTSEKDERMVCSHYF